jgi:hypothetical protein
VFDTDIQHNAKGTFEMKIILIGSSLLIFGMLVCAKPETTSQNISNAQIETAFPAYTPNGVPLEPDAEFAVKIGLYKLDNYLAVIDGAVHIVRHAGYKCDSVTSWRHWSFSRGSTLKCNQYDYTYNLVDHGRGFEVTTN